MKTKTKLSYKQRYEKCKFFNKYLLMMSVGIIIIICGSSLNFIAIKSNDCRMPMYQQVIDTEEYFGFWDKSEVNNFYLTDRFIVDERTFSLGDIFIIFGVFLLLWDLFNLFTHQRIKKYEKTIE